MVYPKSRGIPFNFSHEQELSPEAPETPAPLSLIIDHELLLGNRGIFRAVQSKHKVYYFVNIKELWAIMALPLHQENQLWTCLQMVTHLTHSCNVCFLRGGLAIPTLRSPFANLLNMPMGHAPVLDNRSSVGKTQAEARKEPAHYIRGDFPTSIGMSQE